MSIILNPAISSLETRAYYHTKRQITAVSNVVVSNLECHCLPLNCVTPMPQFINEANPNNTDENDFHTFIFEPINGATMTATLTNLTPDRD